MKQQPSPWCWPPLLTLETARQQSAKALAELARVLQDASPEVVEAALEATARADARRAAAEAAAQKGETPGWN